jgi:AcrR family transcriptional regulator
MSTPQRSPARRARAGVPLTREKILVAARALVDERGLGALSMRALGQALGTSAMALYFHFTNKEEVLDALAAALMEPRLRPQSWTWPAIASPAGRAPGANSSRADRAGSDAGRAVAGAFVAALRERQRSHPFAYRLLVERELSSTAYREAWRDAWSNAPLSPARAELLRLLLVEVAADEALTAAALALFF